jgi:hypothetical protein
MITTYFLALVRQLELEDMEYWTQLPLVIPLASHTMQDRAVLALVVEARMFHPRVVLDAAAGSMLVQVMVAAVVAAAVQVAALEIIVHCNPAQAVMVLL